MEYTREAIAQLSDERLQAEWEKYMAYSVEKQRLREAVQRMLRRKSPPCRVRDDEIPEGGLATTKMGQKEILVAKVEGKIYALDNACGHSGYPLSKGRLEGHVVTCRWHNARFDVRTGEVVAPGAGLMPAQRFRVTISRDETLQVGEEL
jgi:nitrite reductase/ring-hydroxylating ferredoxin subunit